MTQKEEIINKIKQWLETEKKINEFSTQLRELRKNKKNLNVELMEIMKTNDIDCFDCNSGQIVYTKNNVKKALNKKSLYKILQEFDNINNTNSANIICNYILENRETQIRENIKLKPNK